MLKKLSNKQIKVLDKINGEISQIGCYEISAQKHHRTEKMYIRSLGDTNKLSIQSWIESFISVYGVKQLKVKKIPVNEYAAIKAVYSDYN